ncbi:MAG: hypothetical protein ACJA2W_000795 [Planctomycetota bacterium]|jgi:hypothetical protein
MISWSLRQLPLTASRDGTKSFVFTSHELIAKLAALVPHPHEHQLTYQGVLAPVSPLRNQVVPAAVARKEPDDSLDVEGVAKVKENERCPPSIGFGLGGPAKEGP